MKIALTEMLGDFGQSRLMNSNWQIAVAVKFGPLFHLLTGILQPVVLPPSGKYTPSGKQRRFPDAPLADD
ncbi:MAG: hypothetical protein ACREEM_14035 [Blastocatellia bacterium]